jgi:general secretion pathway protein A
MPFSVAPNPRFLFETASYTAALAQVAYALDRRESLVVVTGQIGTGKTLLCRTVVERLERKTFVSVINDPFLERDDLLKLMLQDFGVISRDRTKLVPTTRHDLIHALEEFLASLAPIQAHAILIIDEAQHVRPDVMEQIRLLSNVLDDRGTMLEIVLVGQPDLETMLARPELRQVQQRVSRRVRLESLTPQEVAAYIEHRLAIARGDSTSDGPFTTEAIEAVARHSAGIPRVVNLLCDRALEAAFERQMRQVDASLIESAARALDLTAAELGSDPNFPIEKGSDPFSASASRRVRLGLMLAGAAALMALAIGLGAGLMKRSRAPETAPRPPIRPTAVAAPIAASPASPAPATSDTAGAMAPAGTSMMVRTGTPDISNVPAAPSAEAFEIVVASFRTETRARAVAMDLAALDQPVRRRVADGWQQVLTGPFASRTLADEAQQQLERAGFIGTHIVRTGR